MNNRALTPREQALLEVLSAHRGRVLTRRELARQAGLTELSERRCDSVIAGIRAAIGADQIRTVRRRGWMLVGD